jgi:hypothetical protein
MFPGAFAVSKSTTVDGWPFDGGLMKVRRVEEISRLGLSISISASAIVALQLTCSCPLKCST